MNLVMQFATASTVVALIVLICRSLLGEPEEK